MSGLTELLEAAVKGGVRKGFTNWHGSPHIFDRFDYSKIGTGEGAQVFGHGLYTADARETGEAYQDALKGRADKFEHPQFGVVSPTSVRDYLASVGMRADPKRFGNLDAERKLGAKLSLKARGTAEHIINSGAPAEEQLAGILKGNYPDQKGWAAMAQAYKDFRRQKNPGALYEVNIAADPEADFIQQDIHGTRQSPKVRTALEDLRVMPEADNFGELQLKSAQMLDMIDGEYRRLNGVGDPGLMKAKAKVANAKDWRDLYDGMFDAEPASTLVPGDLEMDYRDLRSKSFRQAQRTVQSGTGRMAYEKLASRLGPAKASQSLYDRGVEGMRFLDKGSRTGPLSAGSKNTVLFSDKLISIVKRYGIAALVGQGLISQQLADALKAQGIDKEM